MKQVGEHCSHKTHCPSVQPVHRHKTSKRFGPLLCFVPHYGDNILYYSPPPTEKHILPIVCPLWCFSFTVQNIFKRYLHIFVHTSKTECLNADIKTSKSTWSSVQLTTVMWHVDASSALPLRMNFALKSETSCPVCLKKKKIKSHYLTQLYFIKIAIHFRCVITHRGCGLPLALRQDRSRDFFSPPKELQYLLLSGGP